MALRNFFSGGDRYHEFFDSDETPDEFGSMEHEALDIANQVIQAKIDLEGVLPDVDLPSTDDLDIPDPIIIPDLDDAKYLVYP